MKKIDRYRIKKDAKRKAEKEKVLSFSVAPIATSLAILCALLIISAVATKEPIVFLVFCIFLVWSIVHISHKKKNHRKEREREIYDDLIDEYEAEKDDE